MPRRKEDVAKIAKGFKSKRSFQIGSPADYQAARRGKYLDEICSHMPPKYKYRTDEELIKISKEYKEKCLLKKENIQVYDRIIQRGLGKIAFAHMPEHVGIGRPGPGYKWTYSVLKKLCMGYSDIKTFIKENEGAYRSMCKQGFTEELTAHMKRHLMHRTDEECHLDALKCKTILEFTMKFPNTYAVSRNRPGLLEKICSHMKRPKISYPEKMILESVKIHFPNAKKIRANKLKIEGKPHIKTLELDIFVPELMKGIEYDSTHFHNFDSLKKSHPSWSNEEIGDYHQIKDSAFQTRGISILHITGEEWKRNSSDCIMRCLSFLGICEL